MEPSDEVAELMDEKEKVKMLGDALIIISRRLLRLEQSEKYRHYLRGIISDVGRDICEFDKCKESK